MGTANTDINLRPSPSPNNEPIGLVTKGSRVKILKSQGRWQQVEIVTQGRDVPEDVKVSSEGWLYGDYVDIDNQ
ncbi:MAG: SH3 domain-containing protein [Pyrinomonadaceae bacterium]|nr:SH3 domain-containing protein [Pyrinomonadaceae bacterium]